jgi:putative membrane protein
MPEVSGEKSEQAEDPRVRFAGERTLLAWVRTGLGLMGFGFVVARFGLFLREMETVRQAPPVQGTGASLGIGVALLVLGVIVTLLAGWEHAQRLRRLARGEPFVPPRWSLGVVLSIVLGGIGVALVVYLLAVGR